MGGGNTGLGGGGNSTVGGGGNSGGGGQRGGGASHHKFKYKSVRAETELKGSKST